MISRREFVLGATASLLAPALARAQPSRAQLLLLRASREPLSCARNAPAFLPGKLYGVPSSRDLASAHPALGLTLLTDTMELPYVANAANVSSIPAGTYSATVRTDRSKPWMTSDDRSWRLELPEVPGRTSIQFHFGTNYTWSRGCIIVTGNVDQGPMCRNAATSSEQSMRAIREYVLANTLNSASEILVRIAFQE